VRKARLEALLRRGREQGESGQEKFFIDTLSWKVER
jgi:hypothetical protein